MAIVNSLPAGATPFSQHIWKDGNDNLWTGGFGEYYKFLDPSDLPYINIKDFGAVGDGVTDDTDAWDEALSVAKTMEMGILIPAGKYPVTVSVDSVNMNGCQGISGDGELVFTSTGNPDRPLLLWAGTKTLIASAIPVTVGQSTFSVGTGLDIGKGDTIFIASNEDVYSDLDPSAGNYRKGGRFTVNSYNSSTGQLVCFEPSYYNMTAAYVYHNNIRPRVAINGVSISIVGDQDKKGIEVRIGELFVDGACVTGFGRFGINASSSLCRITRSLIYAQAIPSTTTGYSLQCSGLSDVIFSDSIFYGNRHGVACGDSGYWRTSDVGGSPDSVIALPPIVRGSGSRIEGSTFALDSHAGTTLLDVYNCDIYGGVIGGALETYVNGCRIHQGQSEMAFRMGRDRSLNTRSFHNKFKIANSDIYATTQVFGVYADLERVDILGVNVYVTPSGSTRGMIAYNSGSIVKNWNVSGIRHFGTSGDSSEYMFRMMNGATLTNLELLYARINIELRNISGRIINHTKVLDSVIKLDSGNAITFDYFDLNKGVDLTVAGTTIEGGGNAINARGAKSMNISNNMFNGQTATTVYLRSSSGAAVPLTMSGNTIRKASGDVVMVQTGQSMPTILIGNIFDGSTSIHSNVEVVGKYGNVGLDDKLKTTLSTSTTTKYGADAGTGDLSLN